MKRVIIIVISVLLVTAAMWLIIISPTSKSFRVIDCSMASFHPDYTSEMRKACNQRYLK